MEYCSTQGCSFIIFVIVIVIVIIVGILVTILLIFELQQGLPDASPIRLLSISSPASRQE
jgi:hypothetical protein